MRDDVISFCISWYVDTLDKNMNHAETSQEKLLKKHMEWFLKTYGVIFFPFSFRWVNLSYIQSHVMMKGGFRSNPPLEQLKIIQT